MTVRFVLGRAGSGKTRWCLSAIAREAADEPLGPPLVMLVPEQATFQTEKALLALCGGLTHRAQVLSFSRLEGRLLNAGGAPVLPEISETGRQMVIRRLLQERKDGLEIFEQSARKARFAVKLSEQFREFKNYGITPEALAEAAAGEGTPPVLQAKLRVLSALYGDYLEYTGGRFSDPEDALSRVASVLRTGALPVGTRIWIDGFSGFTPQEYSVLRALFGAAARVELALCLDHTHTAGEIKENDLFFPTQEAYRRLRILAGQAGVRVLPPLELPLSGQPTRYRPGSGLAHLERNFGAGAAAQYPATAGDVRLVYAANRRAEVEAVARDILHKTREAGWRFREMAVLLRDISPYRELIPSVFASYGIPFFLDGLRPVSHHPLPEFLRSSLAAVQRNFRFEDVACLLKTDLLPLDRYGADCLENYLLEHGIRGLRWLDDEPFRFRRSLSLAEEDEIITAGDRERDILVNRARETFRRVIFPFYKAVTAGRRLAASDYCRALWSLLESVEALAVVRSWADGDERAGEPEKADWHRQVWQETVALLEEIHTVMGDCALTLEEFSEILLSGLEGMRAGLVPAGLDQVLVGGVERSRQPALRAVYVLGLCEGEFPARLGESGLFADSERELLADFGQELAPSRRRRLFYEQYLAYIALTRASELVFAGCPQNAEDGKPKRPSLLFNHLCRMFPANGTEFYGLTPDGENRLHFLAGGEPLAAALLKEAAGILAGETPDELWPVVYGEALRDSRLRRRLELIWPALTCHNRAKRLSRPQAESLYGFPVKSSVSRLELFARCPFAHFARFGLCLRERSEFGVEAPDMGNFYHEALRLFVCGLQEDGIDWGCLQPEEAAARMEKIVDELVPRLRGEILLSSARHRYLAQRLKEDLVRAARRLTRQAGFSTFRPCAVEMPFNLKIREEVNGGLELYGRIDRVDRAKGGDRGFISVIDYKAGPADYKIADTWHGLSLQLPVYLAAALQEGGAGGGDCAAGMFYFPVYTPPERADNPEQGREPDENPGDLQLYGLVFADREVFELLGGREGILPAALKKDGSFTARSRIADRAQLAALTGLAFAKMEAAARAILDGDTAVYPYRRPSGDNACLFCRYRPLCRFENGDGNRWRPVRDFSHGEVLEMLAKRGGEI